MRLYTPFTKPEKQETSPGAAPLLAHLAERCHEFDFFQAVRLLDVEFGKQEYPRIGYSESRRGDSIHFGQRPFLDFAPRTLDFWSEQPVESCRFEKPVLLVFFLGFFGPNGPLPLHLTEHAMACEHRGDFCFSNFANIFQHRFLSFFYRAWAGCRLAVDFDRQDRQRFGRFIGSLGGSPDALGDRTGTDRQLTPDPIPATDSSIKTGGNAIAPPRLRKSVRENWPRLFFAGRLSSRSRNADGLASILSVYFGVTAEVKTFIGRWLDLPPGSESRLGSRAGSALLGQALILGTRIWDCQGSFRIRLGPLKYSQLERLLPGTSGAARLRKWVTEYAGPELHWDVQLILAKEEIPPTLLNGECRLGLTTFLYSSPASGAELLWSRVLRSKTPIRGSADVHNVETIFVNLLRNSMRAKMETN